LTAEIFVAVALALEVIMEGALTLAVTTEVV